MTAFFTSDLHFGHNNIIKYCARPFKNADEMNDALIRNWNEKVTNEDDVYVIGDFSMHQKAATISDILLRLNGIKHLIKGNHDDKREIKKTVGWASVNTLLDLKIDGEKLRLFHYPIVDWRGPRMLFHGHIHGQHPWTGKFSRDVGVDANMFRPQTLIELIEIKEKTQ